MHILFCRHIWAELSLLFWTFLSGTFFPGVCGGGGGVHVHPVHPPCVRAWCFINIAKFIDCLVGDTSLRLICIHLLKLSADESIVLLFEKYFKNNCIKFVTLPGLSSRRVLCLSRPRPF